MGSRGGSVVRSTHWFYRGTRVQVPATTWWLTTIQMAVPKYSMSSSGLCRHQAGIMQVGHTHTHTHTLISKSKRKVLLIEPGHTLAGHIAFIISLPTLTPNFPFPILSWFYLLLPTWLGYFLSPGGSLPPPLPSFISFLFFPHQNTIHSFCYVGAPG